MSDDNLRDKLRALDLGKWFIDVEDTLDFAMPTIREALAEAWDDAVQAAGEHAMGGPMPDNPWREQS